MIRYLTVRVTRDMFTQCEMAIPEWAVPILEAVHAGQLVVLDKVKIVDRPLPDARVEFERLEAAYKQLPSEGGHPGAPVVESVYGAGPRGIRELEQAIKAAYIAEWPKGYVDDLIAGASIPIAAH